MYMQYRNTCTEIKQGVTQVKHSVSSKAIIISIIYFSSRIIKYIRMHLIFI